MKETAVLRGFWVVCCVFVLLLVVTGLGLLWSFQSAMENPFPWLLGVSTEDAYGAFTVAVGEKVQEQSLSVGVRLSRETIGRGVQAVFPAFWFDREVKQSLARLFWFVSSVSDDALVRVSLEEPRENARLSLPGLLPPPYTDPVLVNALVAQVPFSWEWNLAEESTVQEVRKQFVFFKELRGWLLLVIATCVLSLVFLFRSSRALLVTGLTVVASGVLLLFLGLLGESFGVRLVNNALSSMVLEGESRSGFFTGFVSAFFARLSQQWLLLGVQFILVGAVLSSLYWFIKNRPIVKGN